MIVYIYIYAIFVIFLVQQNSKLSTISINIHFLCAIFIIVILLFFSLFNPLKFLRQKNPKPYKIIVN